ncbi:MAG: KR domain-containing protein [Planctomycetes bacterium]|nr:KR domain-containing protein [Planctomycetota bacterium]
MNERFFVTGALGCIGAWVVKHLVERGDRAIVYDLGDDARRLCDIVAEPLLAQVQFVRGDITDLAATRRVAPPGSGARGARQRARHHAPVRGGGGGEGAAPRLRQLGRGVRAE